MSTPGSWWDVFLCQGSSLPVVARARQRRSSFLAHFLPAAVNSIGGWNDQTQENNESVVARSWARNRQWSHCHRDRIILILCICPEFGAKKPRENRARADADEIQLQFTEPTLRGRADVNETLCEQIREPHADKRACQTKTCMKIRFRLTRLRWDKSIRFVLEWRAATAIV